MNITNVNMRKIENQGRVKALASITIDDEFVVHEIKVVESREKIFIAMPSKRNTNGEFKDIAHPINNQVRSKIEEAILKKYQEM